MFKPALLKRATVCWLLLFSWILPLAGRTAEYVVVPGGRFVSVLEAGGTQAPVTVPTFSMRTTPVTVGEYERFAQRYPQWQRDQVVRTFADTSYLHDWNTSTQAGDSINQKQPVTSVSWFAAQAFCEQEGGRLPTWYEWEYAAAADDHHADARKNPTWRARILNWYSQSSAHQPNLVGGDANYYGIRDIHGLIWEWVDDYNALLVSADSRNQGDPDKLQFCGAGAISLQDRENYAVLMRIALLSSLTGADTTNNLGFRCAKTQ